MRLTKDKTALVYNDFLTLAGIPEAAFAYRLGNRSALEWVIDQYQTSTDSRSGLTNDPNREDEPDYIVNLIGKDHRKLGDAETDRHTAGAGASQQREVISSSLRTLFLVTCPENHFFDAGPSRPFWRAFQNGGYACQRRSENRIDRPV
jgi:hypothetical protein